MGIESFISSVCVQTAVYWGNPVNDGFGTRTYDLPVEIKVRWDENPQIIAGKDGKEITCSISVLTPEDLEIGGILRLGTLEETDWTTNPHIIENTYEIMGWSKISMPKSLTQFVRTAYLKLGGGKI
jgi:hypothetical protein